MTSSTVSPVATWLDFLVFVCVFCWNTTLEHNFCTVPSQRGAAGGPMEQQNTFFDILELIGVVAGSESDEGEECEESSL